MESSSCGLISNPMEAVRLRSEGMSRRKIAAELE
jgi:hypothetical protein